MPNAIMSANPSKVAPTLDCTCHNLANFPSATSQNTAMPARASGVHCFERWSEDCNSAGYGDGTTSNINPMKMVPRVNEFTMNHFKKPDHWINSALVTGMASNLVLRVVVAMCWTDLVLRAWLPGMLD